MWSKSKIGLNHQDKLISMMQLLSEESSSTEG